MNTMFKKCKTVNVIRASKKKKKKKFQYVSLICNWKWNDYIPG